MSEGVPTSPMPVVKGLPLDPRLQLWAGYLQPLSPVTLTGGSADPLCVSNPMRVALYVWNSSGGNPFAIGLGPAVPPTLLSRISTSAPVVVHCRDYPGAVQAAWFAAGQAGDVLSLAEYVLQPWW